MAIGFETTAPSTALTLLQARSARASRTSRVFCNHVTIVPAIKAILDSPDLRLDGFHRPGPCLHGDRLPALPVHRARITASRWWWRASSRSTSCSPSTCCCGNCSEGRVRSRESVHARRAVGRNREGAEGDRQTMELRPYFEWRGLGFISQSALKLRDSMRLRCRAASSRSQACAWPIPRPASAARC